MLTVPITTPLTNSSDNIEKNRAQTTPAVVEQPQTLPPVLAENASPLADLVSIVKGNKRKIVAEEEHTSKRRKSSDEVFESSAVQPKSKKVKKKTKKVKKKTVLKRKRSISTLAKTGRRNSSSSVSYVINIPQKLLCYLNRHSFIYVVKNLKQVSKTLNI